jgi:glycosyltransferase involved in cell wall biosynthesis
VDRIVAQSRLRKDEFLSKGVSEEKVTVVEDVPELDQFRIAEGEIDKKLEQRLRPHGEKLLIYSGGMERYQGVDFLLDAFEDLCRKREDIRLVLFGRPLAEYRRMALEAGVSDRVVFVDDEPFGRLPQYLAICDIGFALRLYGGNVPGKLPVYMASAIAVIGTDIEGINTVIKEDQTGLLVAPEDIAGLVSQIERLVDDPELRSSLGKAARAEAEERYSPEAAKAELARVYEGLLRDA